MRGTTIALLIAAVLPISCAGSSTPSATTPISKAQASATPGAATPASTSPVPTPKLAGAYGLLYTLGKLHLVKPDASLAATVPMTWNRFGIRCAASTDSVNSLPPVSASDGYVYFREGGTIRMVVPPSNKVDVTTVPDSSSVISFFSVRPDDQTIAVVVVDTSGPTTITTRLYVEDLRGGGHHVEIYSALASKSSNPTTLWPMGWHKGNLVLAVVRACVYGLAEAPGEWHVSSAVTGLRVATIKGSDCTLSRWPSPAGVACAKYAGPATLFDWAGKVTGVSGPAVQIPGNPDTGMSPAGQSIFFSTGVGSEGPGAAIRLVQLGPGPYAIVGGHVACLWIDEDHLLSTDAVIQFPAETPGNVLVEVGVKALPPSAMPDGATPQSSMCAGRFPGSL